MANESNPAESRRQVYRWESSSHRGTVLSGLNRLRQKSLLFDVTLIVDGCSFEAHRVVLASCSEYFRAMFTGEMKEKEQEVISLNGITAIGMQELLDFAYTSTLTLTSGNVQHVLGAASHLEILPVVLTCSTYLTSQLDLENFVDIVTIAETFSLENLTQQTYQFMAKNLGKIACLYEFQRLNQRQLSKLLSLPYPVECPESEVLEALICWLHYDPPNRAKFSPQLLRFIQFSQIRSDVCEDILNSTACYDIAVHFPEIQSIIMNGMYDAQLTSSRQEIVCNVSGLINLRGFEKAVVNIGGFQSTTGMTNSLTFFHEASGNWEQLTEVPHVEQANFGVAVLRNEIYVVGGCFNQSLQENVHPFGFKYNVYSRTWSSIASMINERCGFFLGSDGEQLYAIGGVDDQEDVPAPPCERYDPETNEWSETAASPSGSKQHAGVVCSGKIYISGGLDWDLVLSSLSCYDIETDTWNLRTEMLQPRADHCMEAYKGNLYVVGGWREHTVTGNRVILDSLDCFNPDTNQWDTISTVPNPTYHCSMPVLNNYIYIIGGLQHSGFNGASKKIQVYNIKERIWTEMEYPEEIWEHQSCVLYVPTHQSLFNEESASSKSSCEIVACYR